MRALVAVALCAAACAPTSAAAPLRPDRDDSESRVAVSTVGPPYDRDAFGDGWRETGDGCDVRDAILARDLTDTTVRDSCNVVAGTLRDPYSGVVVVGPTRQLDVDHRLSLREAWDLGAWRWSEAERVRFANDPENLETTSARANRSKSDKPLSLWRPAVDPCGFARQVDAVADRYGLLDDSRDGVVANACR